MDPAFDHRGRDAQRGRRLRALLVSNWPVETTSARSLTTELFRRQTADSALSRAQALRQTITWLMDGEGYTNPHTNKLPLSNLTRFFWRPFTRAGVAGGWVKKGPEVPLFP